MEVNYMKLNVTILSDCCQAFFELSMDARFSESDRREFLKLGKIFRGHWLNLVTAEFEKGNQEVETANQNLKDLNGKIKEVTKDLDKVAGTIEAAASMAASLEKLLSVAIMFV
jgi:hypothetical protein